MIDPKDAGQMNILDTQSGQISYFSIKDQSGYLRPDLLPFSFYQFDTGSHYTYSLVNGKIKLARQNFRFHGSVINRAARLNENKYATIGFFRTGLLGLYNSKSKLMDYYGHYPITVDLPYERSAMNKIVQSFQGNIVCSDQHPMIVYGSDTFAYLSCYRFTGYKLKFQWEKHIVPLPAAQIVDGFLEYDRTVTQGNFSSVTTAGNHIFACYNQKQRSAIDSTCMTTTHNIQVYGMNGDHIYTYRIDCALSNMAVDVRKKVLYGIARGEESVIVRFDIEI